MRIRNISKKVKCYMKIRRKHIGKTIVAHNLNPSLILHAHMSSPSRCQHTARLVRKHQTGRLWRLQTFTDDMQDERSADARRTAHGDGNAVLDVARSHQRGRIRPQGRHLVRGYHV